MSRIDHIEPAASAASSKALAMTMTSSGAAVFGGWTGNDVAIAVGIVGTVLGIWMQWHYLRKNDRRDEARRAEERAEHLARMSELRE